MKIIENERLKDSNNAKEISDRWEFWQKNKMKYQPIKTKNKLIENIGQIQFRSIAILKN